jgi:hypothetical protein
MAIKTDFESRVKQYMKENEAFLKRNNIAIRLVMNFPRSSKVPMLSRMALWIIGKQGGILDMEFGDPKKK